MAKLGAIREESATQVSKTRELGQKTGAGIVESTFAETNADEVNARLKAALYNGKAANEAARAASTEQAGTAQTQQGSVQAQAGQTLIAAASVAAASGLGAPVSMGMFAAGTALVVTGQGNQAQGEQKVAEAPPMTAKAADYSNQSQNHLNKAEQIRSEKEAEQATNEDSSDTNSAKEIGKGKGYYVADSGNAGASTDTDNELVADRLTDGEKAINAKLGITTDSDTAEGGIATATDDKTTIASRLNTITDNINGLIGAQSDQSSGEQAIEKLGITTASDAKEGGIGTDDKTTIASRLKDGAGEVDNLLGVEKEKIG